MYESQNFIAHESQRLDSLGVGILFYHLLEGVGYYHVVSGALHEVWRKSGRVGIDAIAIDHILYCGQLPDVVAVGIDEERVFAIGQILAERQSAVGDDVTSYTNMTHEDKTIINDFWNALITIQLFLIRLQR